MKPLPKAGFEVPERYHKDILQLMIRDAHTLYVYWEISNRKKWLTSRHFDCDWEQMPKILRIYNVTAIYFNGHNAHAQFDLQVTPEADNWFIHGVSAGASYLIDFGTYTWDHSFIPLLRSNAMATPRDTSICEEPPHLVVSELTEAAVMNRIIPQYFENIQPYSPSKR